MLSNKNVYGFPIQIYVTTIDLRRNFILQEFSTVPVEYAKLPVTDGMLHNKYNPS